MSATAKMGLLVGGGPAPGINSAIVASVTQRVNSGPSVVGMRDRSTQRSAGRADMLWPAVASAGS